MRSGVWVRLPWHHTLKPLLHPSPAARKPHPTTVIVIWHFSAQTLTALYTARLVYPFILSELFLWHSQSDGELRQVSTLAKDIRRGSNGCEKCKLGGLEVKLWFHCLINVKRTYHHHVSQAGYYWSSEEPRPITQQHAKHTNSNEEEKLKVEVRLLLPSHSQEFISTHEENTFTTCHTDWSSPSRKDSWSLLRAVIKTLWTDQHWNRNPAFFNKSLAASQTWSHFSDSMIIDASGIKICQIVNWSFTYKNRGNYFCP